MRTCVLYDVNEIKKLFADCIGGNCLCLVGLEK
jgi:hypothetical protein